jgi:hypothetical protein
MRVRPYVSVVPAVLEKQIPPLRRRIRSGSGRNDRALFAAAPGLSFAVLSTLLYKYLYSEAEEIERMVVWKRAISYGEELV